MPQPRVAPSLAVAVRRLRRALRAFADPYRPELHYMRGPGPKWHAKYDRAPVGYGAMPALVPVRARVKR
jgi:hypothetical protein